MKAPALILVPVAMAALVGCGGRGGAETQPQARCYQLLDGSSRSVAKIAPARSADNPQGGQITIYSYLDGVEEFTPETTAGRLESDAFVYGDGTRLALTADTLTWPKDSLLEGAVFTSAACP